MIIRFKSETTTITVFETGLVGEYYRIILYFSAKPLFHESDTCRILFVYIFW